MTGSNDVAWTPQPLPEVLTEQLRSHGFEASDTAEVARQIGEAVGPAASASLFVDLGACNFLEGDIDGAIATWRRAVASGQVAPGARALLNLGLLYEHLHLHDRAISVLHSASERQAEPFATEAAIAEARCQCAKGDNDAGLRTLARLTENLMVNQPRSGLLGHALLQLGDVARRSGRPDRAERAWKAAAGSHLRTVENQANEKLIELLVDLGRDDEARQVIDASTTSRSSLTSSQRLYRAELLIDLGRGDHAVELLATIRGDQLDTTERFRLAEMLLGQGLINESIDHLETLTELPLIDHRVRARYALAEVYRQHGMLVEAEEMYTSVIDSDHRYWASKAGLQLGDLHDQRNDIEGAVGLWVRAASSPVEEIREDAEARLTERLMSRLIQAEPDEDAAATLSDDDRGDGDAEGDSDAESESDAASEDTPHASPIEVDDAAAIADELIDGAEDEEDVEDDIVAAGVDPVEGLAFSRQLLALDGDDSAAPNHVGLVDLDAASGDDHRNGDMIIDHEDSEGLGSKASANSDDDGDDADEPANGSEEYEAPEEDGESGADLWSNPGALLLMDDTSADDKSEGDELAADEPVVAADDESEGDEAVAVTGDNSADVESQGDEAVAVTGDNSADDESEGDESVAVTGDNSADDESENEQPVVAADDESEGDVPIVAADGDGPTEEPVLAESIDGDPVDGVVATAASAVEEPAEEPEPIADAPVAEPEPVIEQPPVVLEPVVQQPPPFVAPRITGPPKVIPLRAANLQDDFIPPARVHVPDVAPSDEPLIVALGSAHNDQPAHRADDMFAELAPPDAHVLAGPATSSAPNPYAELSPVHLSGTADDDMRESLPTFDEPSVPTSDELRWKIDEGDPDEVPDDSHLSSGQGFFSSQLDD